MENSCELFIKLINSGKVSILFQVVSELDVEVVVLELHVWFRLLLLVAKVNDLVVVGWLLILKVLGVLINSIRVESL